MTREGRKRSMAGSRIVGSSQATSAPLSSSADRLPMWSINPGSLPGFYFYFYLCYSEDVGGSQRLSLFVQSSEGHAEFKLQLCVFTSGENEKVSHLLGSLLLFCYLDKRFLFAGSTSLLSLLKQNTLAAAGFPGMRPRPYGIVGKIKPLIATSPPAAAAASFSTPPLPLSILLLPPSRPPTGRHGLGLIVACGREGRGHFSSRRRDTIDWLPLTFLSAVRKEKGSNERREEEEGGDWDLDLELDPPALQ